MCTIYISALGPLRGLGETMWGRSMGVTAPKDLLYNNMHIILFFPIRFAFFHSPERIRGVCVCSRARLSPVVKYIFSPSVTNGRGIFIFYSCAGGIVENQRVPYVVCLQQMRTQTSTLRSWWGVMEREKICLSGYKGDEYPCSYRGSFIPTLDVSKWS